MPMTIPQLFAALRKAYGPTHWWPGDSSFEIMVGAILTQNTSWRNVEKAIADLKKAGLMSPAAIASANLRELQRAVRSSGFYMQKSRYLRALSRYIVDHYSGDVGQMKRRRMHELRDELVDIPGIGDETADEILLYALGMPSFVVDSYTRRLLKCLGMDHRGTYSEIQSRFEDALGNDAKAFGELHALIVTHGKAVCRKSPHCCSCPIARRCPSRGEH